MALTYPIQRKYVITQTDHTNTLILGNAAEGRVATWAVQWVPNPDFIGQFAITGRVYGKPASDDKVGFGGIPYRRVNLAGVASDLNIVSDLLSQDSWMVNVPANGWSVGVQVVCTQGSGTLYSWDLAGPAAP